MLSLNAANDNEPLGHQILFDTVKVATVPERQYLSINHGNVCFSITSINQNSPILIQDSTRQDLKTC